MIILPWVRRHMVFMSPDGDAGGGTATLEAPPPAEAPMTPVGQLYTDALAKSRGEETPDRTPAASGPTGPASTSPAATGPAASGVTGPAASGATGPAKPKSAIDALMDEPGPIGETGPGGQDSPTANDFLKDLPETLPREGRGAHWEKARGAIATQGKTISQLNKTIADVTRQLEEAKTSPAANEENAALKKQLDEYKDAIVGINVEYSPEHRKEFIEGRATLVTKASEKLVAFGGDGPALEKALKMPESRARTEAIKAAMGDLDGVEAGRVMGFITEIDKLDDRRAEIMKDPQGSWKKLQEGEKARALAAQTQKEEFKAQKFDALSKTLPTKYFLLRPVDPSVPGALEHNAEVEKMHAGARALLNDGANPDDLVEAAFAKQVLPNYQREVIRLHTELKTALALVAEMEVAAPGFRGGTPPAKTALEEKLDKTPGQIFQESLAASKGQ